MTENDIYEVVYNSKPIGLRLSYNNEKHVPVVQSYETKEASMEGRILLEDELVSVNDVILEGAKFKDAAFHIWSATLPMHVRLRRSSTSRNSIHNQVAKYYVLPIDQKLLLQETTESILEEYSRIDTSINRAKIGIKERKELIESLDLERRSEMLSQIISQIGSDIFLTLSRLESIDAIITTLPTTEFTNKDNLDTASIESTGADNDSTSAI